MRKQKAKIIAIAINLAVVLFIMALGAGCYHQYLMLFPLQIVHAAETVEEPACKPAVPDTQEQIAEEMYWDSLELLALVVEAEAGNQDLQGRCLVVDVILNRVDDPDWPDSIEAVITQPYQFSTYWNGAVERVEPSELTYEAIRLELEHRSVPDIYYFTAGNFGKYGSPWKKVGDHYFSGK